MTAFVFDLEQLRAAGERYVAEGPAGTRAQRQEEVDGALMFLQSDAAAKLRPVGLQPKDQPLAKPARTVLEAMETPRG